MPMLHFGYRGDSNDRLISSPASGLQSLPVHNRVGGGILVVYTRFIV
jgi:hypothetical protein